MPVTRRPARACAPQSCSMRARAGRWSSSCAAARRSEYGVTMAASGGRRALGALAVAVVCAEGAARLLAPRDGVIAGVGRADAANHFGAEEIARARRYGRGQRALGAAGAASELALLAWLVRRGRGRPASVLPLPAAGARGACLSLALGAATLPSGALMRKRALDARLATQSWQGWAGDVARSAALGAGFAAAGAVVVAALMRRYDERWWAP